MRLDTSMRPDVTLRQTLMPRMIQSMEILQLPSLALQERIDRELIENPLLVDLRESGETAASTGESDGDEPSELREIDPEVDSPTATANLEPTPPTTDEFDFATEFPEFADLEPWERESKSRATLAEESDRKLEAMQNMASRPPSLVDDLSLQLGYLDLEPTLRRACDYIIANLDDHGFFRLPLEDVVRDVPGLDLEMAREALRVVQKLDPPGIAARDLKECLLLQITPETRHADLVATLIRHHLDDIGHNRLPIIERKTGAPLERIKEAIEQLRKFNPRPASGFTSGDQAYIVPDLIVEQNEQGRWVVRLDDSQTPRLGISPRYQSMLKNKQADAVTREYIKYKIDSARWLIDSIEQRKATLLKVAQAIIDYQTPFLNHGPEHIQPLKMQQIADQVGVHVTTVSRAVDDKWIQTPRGLLPLKRFFGGGTRTSSGEEVAYDQLRLRLQEMIAQEDKRKPLSDEEIVKAFEKEGITLARRTVTKYRETLGIPSSRQRRVY